jgi:hypothetical protein
MWNRASGFRGLKSCEHSNRSRKIVKRDIPMGKRTVWGHRSRRVDRWHTISGFRSEKSRKICIRIRDIANSEMSME